MKTKKDYLIDLINEKIAELDIDNNKLLYILLNKDSRTFFRYNENINININKENSNFDYLSRLFHELNYNSFKLSFNEFLKITEKYVGSKNMDNIFKNELYLFEKINTSRHSINEVSDVTNFFTFERYFKQFIKEDKTIVNASKALTDYQNDLTVAINRIKKEEDSNFINFILSRVKENGTITFTTKIIDDVDFIQKYKYNIENGEIKTDSCEELLNVFYLNLITEDLKYDVIGEIKNKKQYREKVVHANKFDTVVEKLSKELLRVKLNERLPIKSLKVKKNKI